MIIFVPQEKRRRRRARAWCSLEMIDSFIEDHWPARERFQNLEPLDIAEETVDFLGDRPATL